MENLSIILSFTCLLSCQTVNRQEDTTTSIGVDNKIAKTIQGSWILTENPQETIVIKDDSIAFLYENELAEKFVFRISDYVVQKSDTIRAQQGEYIFEIVDDATIDIYYLLGVDVNEFSMMAYSNGQTLVYRRKK